MWFAASMSYYGISYNSGNLSPDAYMNWVLTSLLLPFSTWGGIEIIERMGRRNGNTLLFGACSVCIGIGAIAPACATSMSMVGNFFANSAFNCVYMQVPELYPTRYSPVVLGLASASARIGSMTASYIPYAIGGPATLATVTITCLLAVGVSAIIIPETQGKAFPTSLPSPSRAVSRRSRARYRQQNPVAGDEWRVLREGETLVGAGARSS